mmetsp:Transcript_5971/g.5269  ORF Transcript_5971/g.5269 Transcript_5971/m.5269 type:complete len:218 (+) Transcript_5971:400-1053(+)
MLQDIFDTIINTPFERYICGILTQNFSDNCLNNIDCAPHDFKQIVESFSNKIFEQLIVAFNNKMTSIKKIRLKHLSSMLNKSGKNFILGFLKWKGIIQQQLTGLSCNLRDIITIISDSKMLRKLLILEKNERVIDQMNLLYENIFLLALICNSLTHLSLSCEHLTIIANNCVHNITDFIKLTQKLEDSSIINQLLTNISSLIQKEIGLSKDAATNKY